MKNSLNKSTANEFKTALCREIASWDSVLGVAQTGDIHAPLVPGKSDIDLFVLCEKVPELDVRRKLYAGLRDACDELQMEVCNCETWGIGDIFIVDGIDIMPMYFETGAFSAYLDDVLTGGHLYREGRFYPIGRLATVESINILSEREHVWTDLIQKVKDHPTELFARWYQAQSSLILDEEDLSRVLLRKEVLFYHQVLEEALDHFLQALYAVNGCYFPSRKRNEQAIEGFSKKPIDCSKRMLSVIRNAVTPETMEASVNELRALTEELKELGSQFLS